LRRALQVAQLAQPSDAKLEATFRAESYSIPHVIGTCALGAVGDADAV
jgi:hypothetical protein